MVTKNNTKAQIIRPCDFYTEIRGKATLLRACYLMAEITDSFVPPAEAMDFRVIFYLALDFLLQF